MPAVKEPMETIEKTIRGSELGDYIGKYIKVWRNSASSVVKIVGFDDPTVEYTVMTGKDKGRTYKSRYVKQLSVRIYEEGQLMLAIMDT